MKTIFVALLILASQAAYSETEATKKAVAAKAAITADCSFLDGKEDESLRDASGDLLLPDEIQSDTKRLASFLRKKLRLPTSTEWQEMDGKTINIAGLLPSVKAGFADDITAAKGKVTKAYAQMAKKTGRIPTAEEMAKHLGMELNDYQHLFTTEGLLFASTDELKMEAWNNLPGYFVGVIDNEYFSEAREQEFVEAAKKHSRIIVIGAVAGQPVNRTAFEALLTYAKERDAVILVRPINLQTFGLDPVLFNTPGVHVVTRSVELNTWWKIWNIKLMAKMVNPLAGLQRIGERGISMIVGAPKIEIETVPTDNVLFPHQLWTTAAITDAIYSGHLYVQGRTDEITYADHRIGAMVLEKGHSPGAEFGIPAIGTFHSRYLPFIPKKSGFFDIDTLYTPQGSTKEKPEAIVMGDTHVGITDPELLIAKAEQLLPLEPRYLVLHDFLDMLSINHWEEKQGVTRARRAQNGQLSLEDEIKRAVVVLNALLSKHPHLKIVIVPSNHNGWLHQWVQKGGYATDDLNRAFGVELADRWMNHGKDPVEYALASRGLEDPDRVRVLKLGEPFLVGPVGKEVNLSKHGDLGANGMRGSFESIRRGLSRSIHGHTHTVKIKGDTVNTGTSTILPEYAQGGFHNDVRAGTIVTRDGAMQLIQLIDGKLYTPDNVTPDEPFFDEGFPRLVPMRPISPDGVGQIDQYGRGR